MKCENCKSKHDGSYGSGRFCTSKCARGFSTKGKRSLINEKVASKLRKVRTFAKCPQCDNEFEQRNKRHKFCSRSCNSKYHCTDEAKKNISLKAKERVANGIHSGWQTRNIRSYAEKFFDKVMSNNNLAPTTEYKICKRDLGINSDANYFLDFYFEDIKLDLEIDGKQHDYEDRIISDNERDCLLNGIGIKVYRIEWKNPNNEKNKEYMKQEIQKFLAYIHVPVV